MDDVMTVPQIEAQFESEWVLLENPQTNEALEVQSGKVLWHSKDREEVHRKAVELRPKRFAVLYMGKMPKDTAIVWCPALSTNTMTYGHQEDKMHLGTRLEVSQDGGTQL